MKYEVTFPVQKMVLSNNSIHFIISDSGYLVVKLHFGHVYFCIIGIDSTHGWTATTRYGVHLPMKICKCWFAKTLVIHLEWFIWTKKYKYLKKKQASLSGHLEVSALLDVRHCPKLQSCAISRKTNDATLSKWEKP